MRTEILIDAIVRQVTVLIAQLATAGGVRAPLAHLANQVFVDLARELSAQGVSRKVSADMFGMALRAYLRKVRRLSESSTQRGTTLWAGLLAALEDSGGASRRELVARFPSDDESVVRAVLHDLVDSGLVFVTGQGADAFYRAASDADLLRVRESAAGAGLDELVCVLIYREGPLDRRALQERVPGAHDLDAVLERLLADGRIELAPGGAEPRYRSAHFSVPLEAGVGWEAAVLDHVQAVVRTIVQRLSAPTSPGASDEVGGSTYSFDIWPGHPLEAEVRASLARFREAHGELRARVEAHNEAAGLPDHYQQVVVHGGQHALDRGPDEPA